MMRLNRTSTQELQALSSKKRVDQVIQGSLTSAMSFLVLSQRETQTGTKLRLVDLTARVVERMADAPESVSA